MENTGEKPKAGEAIIRWTVSQKRDFSKGMELMELSGYKPHVFKRLKDWGSGDPRAHRALYTELCNCLRDSRRAVREAQKAERDEKPETQNKQPVPQDTDEQVTGSIDSELQKEYPDIIKRALTEFRSLYVSRSILHRELKAVGEQNDEKSVNERKRKLVTIDAVSRRMDILWGIVDLYKKDGSLPADTFFDEPFDPEKTERETAGDPPDRFILPANMEELQKLKEKLRAGIYRLENRLEYQSDTKGEKPAPMPEGPKHAGVLQRIEDMKKQKEAVEFRIAELK